MRPGGLSSGLFNALNFKIAGNTRFGTVSYLCAQAFRQRQSHPTTPHTHESTPHTRPRGIGAHPQQLQQLSVRPQEKSLRHQLRQTLLRQESR
jgi:hypothetical protein